MSSVRVFGERATHRDWLQCYCSVVYIFLGQGVFIVSTIFSLQAINAKGGRYLEAQVQGSKTQAEEGTLVILAAGDRSLFDDCQSCFKAMGKNSFYLG